jgi:hypothetical protein
MKRQIVAVGACVAIALLLGCDAEEKNAVLEIYNCLGFENQETCSGGDGAAIAEFWLTGDEKTKNLLDGVVQPAAFVTLTKKVLPGTYLWHVKYAAGSSLADHYDGQIEIEIYPGRNHIKLVEGTGGIF